VKLFIRSSAMDYFRIQRFLRSVCRYIMSCHVMSCHVMSCHVISCYVMLCYILYVILRYVMLYYIILYYIILYYIILYYIILYYIILYINTHTYIALYSRKKTLIPATSSVSCFQLRTAPRWSCNSGLTLW